MEFADNLSDEECKRVKLKDIESYKENWNIIKEKAIILTPMYIKK
jgi:hypothetical protein